MAQEEVDDDAGVEKSVTFTTLKPVLIVEALNVGDAINFYESAFDAVVVERSLYPKRKLDQELPHVIYAELELAGTTIVILDVSTYPGSSAKSEATRVVFGLETNDGEAAVEKACSAGAVKVGEVETKEGVVKEKVTDPYGFTWIISSPAKIENAEEINHENQEHLIIVDGNIDRLRDMVMEQLEHFQEFTNSIIGHAIDSFVYRGPTFEYSSTLLDHLLLLLDKIASNMCHWIHSIMEAVDDEVDAEVYHAVSEDDEWLDPVPKLYASRIFRWRHAHADGKIEYDAFFHKRIALGRKILNAVHGYGKNILDLCPTLETSGELHGLYELISECLLDTECIDDDQKALERDEDRISRDGRQLRGVWWSLEKKRK